MYQKRNENLRASSLVTNTAGPTSSEDYFQKGAFLGQKAALILPGIDVLKI